MFASDLTEERKNEICTKIAERIVHFRLSPIAIILLESVKPISFLGSQLMVFFAPMITAFTTGNGYDEMTAFLEDRPNLEMLIQTIEAKEAERNQKEKEIKKARSEKRGKRK
ncbi:hypothetical protein GX441_00755 [bacterium]|nr:hypothetical protein [bacterium]